MSNFNKIDVKDLKLGTRFSAPVFFDDGESMFLAEEKTLKQYHLVAISRWKIPYLLTYGHVLTDDMIEELSELDEIVPISEIEDCEECEEVEDVDDVEELEEV